MNRTEQSYQSIFDKRRRQSLISSSEIFVSYQCRSEFVAVTDGHERRRGDERRGKESKGNGRAGQDMTREEERRGREGGREGVKESKGNGRAGQDITREEKIREDTRVESRH